MNYCVFHGYFSSPKCPICEQQHRETIGVLEAHLSDQSAELLDLRRQVNGLRSIVLDLQRAHNLAQQPHFMLVQPAKFGKWCEACALYTTSDTPGVRCSECGQ